VPYLVNDSTVTVRTHLFGTKYVIEPGATVEVRGDKRRRGLIAHARSQGGLLVDLAPDVPAATVEQIRAQAKSEAEAALADELTSLRAAMAEQAATVRALLTASRKQAAVAAKPEVLDAAEAQPVAMETMPPKPKKVAKRRASSKKGKGKGKE